jgi:23S rRNA (adenine-N6)-dimethyltransferase
MPRRTEPGARRALGQHFLADPRIVNAVLDALDAPRGALVVDLGAGAGALTAAAAARGHRVVAVEVDARWAGVLRSRAPAWGDVTVVHGDALAVPLPGEPHFVVSSVPYAIGTALVRRLLSDAHGLVRASLVLQLETARRLAGDPRSGRFASTWAPWFTLRAGRRIPAAAFEPPPSVDSALLTLEPRAVPLLSPAAFDAYDRFLGRVFSGRGRTVAERLGRGGARAVAAAGLPRTATPSEVAPDRYAALFQAARGGPVRASRRPGAPSARRAGPRGRATR